MAEHSFERPDAGFAAETELLRGANTLPTLSNRLRARVLEAATSAYRQARRGAEARQAASFLSVCLLASLVVSPFASMSLPRFDSPSNFAAQETYSSPRQPNSAWTLSHDRELVGLPREADPQPLALSPQSSKPRLVARSESSLPRDKLLTALHSSDGWATVQAFQAVRSRSQSALQRAFAAN